MYALTDPQTRAVRYIGKTVWDPPRRLRKHLIDAHMGRGCHLHRWLLTLPTLPAITLLDRATCQSHLDALEREWIRYGRQLGWQLVNQTDGGTGGDPGPVGRAKIGEANRRRQVRPESIKKRLETLAALGKPLTGGRSPGFTNSPETRERISQAKKGQTKTPKHREALSVSLLKFYEENPGPFTGRTHTPETRAKLREARDRAYAAQLERRLRGQPRKG